MSENGKARDELGGEGTSNGGVEAGDAACWLARVCVECGAISDTTSRAQCWRCGAKPPVDP